MARYSTVKYTLLLCIMLTSKEVSSTSCNDGYYYDKNGKCMSCPSHCLFCDSITKCLSCENGYWGEVCERECSKCKTGTGCEKTNGFCFDSCLDGLSGILCDVKCNAKCSSCNRTHINLCLNCASGRYPAGSCDLTCSNCNNTACDENGDCISGCVNGYWNKTCMSDCPEDCINKSCEFGNGSCTYGSNKKHDEPISDKEKETNSRAKVGIGVTLTVVVLGGVVGIFIFQRKRHTRKRSNGAPQDSSQMKDGKDEETSAHLLKGPDIHLSNNEVQVLVPPIPKTGREKLLKFIQRLQTMTDKDYQDQFDQLCDTLESNRETHFVKGFEKQNLLPIDPNHFTVEMDNGKSYTVNASFIETRKSNLPVYVACKGPTDDKSGGFDCFWTMLWKLDCTTVVMLNTLDVDDIGKNDLKQYWPTRREPRSFGQIFVEYTTYKKEENEKYISRTFRVTKGKETKTVTQLQYEDWPEKVSAGSVQNLLNFLKLVHETNKADRGPLVVHGRAGAGRTGTFIALDILVQEAEDMVDSTDETKLDVFNCVRHLRAQRKKMVENLEQYTFLHQALSSYIKEILDVKITKEKDDVLESAEDG